MKTIEWTVSDLTSAKHIGAVELESGEYFEVMETPDRLVFGGACNAGFLESGFMLRDEDESIDESLRELVADLEVYYSDGPRYVSRIVCNERM